jgi:hypothetical protein
MDLDELLAAAAPPTARRTVDLELELRRLVREVEPTARPQRRRVRAALVGLATAATVALGTATAMAAGVVPTPGWLPWTTGTGSTCEMQFTARPLFGGATPGRRYTHAERREAVDEANRFLASFDYASVDEQSAIEEFQAEEDVAINGQPDPNERQPRLTGDDLAITAVGFEVWDALEDHLRSRGLDPTLVGYGQGWKCGE